MFRYFLLACLLCGPMFRPATACASEAYRTQLESLASKCEELGLAPQAAVTRAWHIPRDPGRQYLFLPAESEPVHPPANQPKLVTFWWQYFQGLRQQRAEELFQQAQAAITAGEGTRGYALLHETLHENPDHAAARAALGYRLVNERWRIPGAETRVRQPRVAHGTTRWPAGSYWRIETSHYDISTNLSAEAGEQLGQRLELLYDAWRQLFFPYWCEASTLAHWLEQGQPARRSLVKHKVVLFAKQAEYMNMLSPNQPQAAITLGIYMDRSQTAFFFAGDAAAIATQYHEAAHQLFHEVGRPAGEVGERNNFWIVEGVALYLESLRAYEGYATVGGFDADRLQFARYRLLSERFYLPLADMCSLGRPELQQHQHIRQLYSQAAGLAHFLMDYEGGKYRKALDAYLQYVYAGRAQSTTLAQLAQAEYPLLDRQYREFLNVTDADLAYLAGPQHVERLTLGHTAVTDDALQHLAGYNRLIWLDLTARPITEMGLASLAECTALEQLSLDRTRVGDASLPIIGRFTQLTELDLSHTQVTPLGLTSLSTLPRLESLWLTGTKLSDAAVEPLSRLKSLTYLNVNQAGLSAEGWQRLKQQLPKLGEE